MREIPLNSSTSSPLVEAVCEFRYGPSPRWDWTVPGRLFEQFKDEFSQTESVGSDIFEVHPGTSAPIEIPLVSSPALVRCKRPDGSALIQVGPGMLSINHMAQGYSWAEFHRLIKRVRDAHTRIAATTAPIRIGLRYINRLPIGPDGLRGVIAPIPVLTGALGRSLLGYYHRIELEHADICAALVVQIGQQFLNARTMAVVDLDMGTRQIPPTGLPDVDGWLSEAHDRVKRAFVDTLTQSVAMWAVGGSQ